MLSLRHAHLEMCGRRQIVQWGRAGSEWRAALVGGGPSVGAPDLHDQSPESRNPHEILMNQHIDAHTVTE
jgi:hypothetical protein